MAVSSWTVMGPGLLVPAQFDNPDTAVRIADEQAKRTKKHHVVVFAVHHYDTTDGHANGLDANRAAACVRRLKDDPTDEERIRFAMDKVEVAQRLLSDAYTAWTNRKGSSDEVSTLANDANLNLCNLVRALQMDLHHLPPKV